MSRFPLAIQTLGSSFRWRTQDGRTLLLHEMKTGHIFNSMKMLFNHIAEAYGATPIWYQHSYDTYKQIVKQRPKSLARTVALFCYEIERRGDLDIKYYEPYRLIMEQILGIKEWVSDAEELPVNKPVSLERDMYVCMNNLIIFKFKMLTGMVS